jgi:hypothetical protein
MFATKLDLFSIGTIKVPIHTEPISKLVHIPDLSIAKPVLKQHVEPICVLAINLVVFPNITKQHLFKIFFYPEVGEMIIDETHAREQVKI